MAQKIYFFLYNQYHVPPTMLSLFCKRYNLGKYRVLPCNFTPFLKKCLILNFSAYTTEIPAYLGSTRSPYGEVIKLYGKAHINIVISITINVTSIYLIRHFFIYDAFREVLS